MDSTGMSMNIVKLCRGKWKIMFVADTSHEDSSKDTYAEVKEKT